MKSEDEHSWNLHQDEKGNLPESSDAFERKFAEWQKRDWRAWLAENLSFPFTVTREEDADDACFQKGAAKAPFRLGHTFEVIGPDEEMEREGVIVDAMEKGEIGFAPLCDLEVTSKKDANFWPVREYVVWSANRCC